MDTNELEIERAKLELELEKIAVEKQRVAQERELEMKKARWVAGSVIVPVVVAAATISFGLWNQNKTAKDNLVAKALEVVMKAEDPDPGVVRGKAIQVSQILPKALPINFGETFAVDQKTSPSPASLKELLKLILDHPSRRNEIIDMWVKLWPLDTNWAEKLRGDEGH